MSRKSETKQINKHEYSVTQMDAVEAFKAQIYLTKVLSPFFGKLQNVDSNRFLKMLPEIFTQVDDDRFHDFFIKTCEEAFRDGERVEFNQCFTGNLLESYQCFIFVIKVNFSDFIKGATGIDMQKIIEPVASKKDK